MVVTKSQGAAFITGGASGIGYGMAEEFASRGLAVVIADINGAAAEAAALKLGASGHSAHAVQLDVREPQGWSQALDFAEEKAGEIVILASNAGITGSVHPILQSSLEGWRLTQSVNLDGCFLAAQLGIPRLLSHGRPAHFVATSSGGAFATFATNGAYAAAKAGVNALCETLREELRDTNVEVSILCPGLVDTSIHETSRALAPAHLDLGAHSETVIEASKSAISSREVGRIVADALDQHRFWIFTSPGIPALMAQKNEEMAADSVAVLGS